MGKRLAFCLFLLTLLALAVACGSSEDSEAGFAADTRVFIQTEGGYVESSGYGNTVEGVITTACERVGYGIGYTSLGAIESVNGLEAAAGTNWNIHQWMPLGTHDWAEVGFDGKSDSLVINGASYCLHISGQTMVNGVNVYGKPDFKPVSEGYVFIRFDYGYDEPTDEVQTAFTTEDRINGFWIKGTGSNMGEVVKDAMETYEFECSFIIGEDSAGNDLQYWITSFFGIEGSTNLGGPTDWAYWSQYMYVDDKWSYNQWTLGYYDPAVYRYFAIVYIISLDWSEAAEGAEDVVLMSLPDVTDEACIAGQVKRDRFTVSFELDGETIKTMTARYNYVLEYADIPDPAVPEGYYFSGWGDVSGRITDDVVLKGSILEVRPVVTYLNDDGTVLHRETVGYGKPATYGGIPVKEQSASHTFAFVGWTADGATPADLSSVTSNVTVSPMFAGTLRTYDARFILNGAEVKSVRVPYGSPVPPAEIPVVEVPEGKYFTGWGRDTGEAIAGDTEFRGDLLHVDGNIVTYLDAGGGIFYKESVAEGGNARFQGIPEKPGTDTVAYAFRGWSVDGSTPASLENIAADVTVRPLYDQTERRYSVTFVLNGVTERELSVPYNHTLSDSEIPAVDVPPGKYFTGWGDTASPILQDRVFRGSLLSEPTHSITYMDGGGNVVGRENVEDGAPAKFSEKPTKAETQSAVYTFKGWSEDGSTVVDLSSVTRSYVLVPVYDSELKSFKVTFFDHDGEILAERSVRYGDALTDYPEDPFRPASVDKVYTFSGWSLTTWKYLPVDLGNVTSSKVAYAAYGYVSRPYTLTIHLDDGSAIAEEVRYGGFLSESLMMGSVEGYLLRLYRDAAKTERVDTSLMFSGDTTLYATKVPGKYAYSNAERTSVTVSLGGALAELREEGGAYPICDISSFSDGKTAELGTGVLREIESHFGKSVDIRVSLYRGDLTISTGDLIGLCGEGEKTVSFSIGRGPTSSVRINSSLKNIDCDRTYTVSLKVDGKTVIDMPGAPMAVAVPYELDPDPSVEPRVWGANANTGSLTPVVCGHSDGMLRFSPQSYPYFAVGTSAKRTERVYDGDPCPYGEVEYNCTGETSETYASTLERMALDNGGRTLHVPSAMEGYPLKHIDAGAFSGVRNAPTIVIPDTVLSFDWASLDGTDVTKVCFLGDKPEFVGEPPASVTAFHASDADGWEETDYGQLNVFTFSKDLFAISYYLLDDEIAVKGWIAGANVDIPASVSVGGTEYPVTTIGCNAFMNSGVVNVRIPATVDAVQTRAFYGSNKLEQLTWAPGSSVTVIADEAFRACAKLRSNTGTVPDGVRFIGFEAFRDCGMFRSIVLPGSVTDVRAGAFYNCPLLADVVIGGGIDAIPARCFAYCNVLDGVMIPDGVLLIGNHAFYKCDQLSYINTNGAESVGIEAFRLCQSLESVILGASLGSIGKRAFAECRMLKSIDAYCGQPDGFADAFDVAGTVPESVTTYVNYDVKHLWTIGHEVIEKEDDLKVSFVAKTMPAVILSMTVFFVVLGIITARFRKRMMWSQ